MKSGLWQLLILLLVAVNVLLFWPDSLYFLNDDLLHIPLTDEGKLFQTNSVRPIHELLVMTDLWLYGKSAYGYHITALLLHFIVTIQVFDLSLVLQAKWLKIEKRQALNAAFLSVVLFLAYSQHAESLAWILGRTPVLSTVFLLLVVRLSFLPQVSWDKHVIGAILFAASLFTYEQGVLLPLALIILAVVEKDIVRKRSLYTYVFTLLFTAAIYVIVRKLMTAEILGNYEAGNLVSFSIGTLFANAFRIFFRLWLNPLSPRLFYYSLIVFTLLVIGIAVLFYKKVKTNKNATIFFVSIILLLVTPVISLGVTIRSYESGRYLYTPSVFLAIAFSITIISVWYQNKFRRLSVVLVTMLLVYWLWGKYTASRDYRDASRYAFQTNNKVLEHFNASSDTLVIDTLHVTVHRLPVFRLGFKTGIKWLNQNVDTNKVVVRYYYDEFTDPTIR